MSDELKDPGISDAEIAGIMGWRGPGVYSGPTLRKIRRVLDEDRARRTAPVSSPIGEELPAPDVHASGDLFGSPSAYSRSKIEHIVAPYAARIRQLEREVERAGFVALGTVYARDRELAERKTVSIGEDREFHRLLAECEGANRFSDPRDPADTLRALIAYIDGRTAGVAPAGWKLVPIEPTQAMCDVARTEAMDWQNSGDAWAAMTWFRIYKRMLAAAPTPMNSGKEEGNADQA